MKRLWIVGAIMFLTMGVQASGAARQSASGDTCSAAGSSGTYTLVISLPSGAAEQGAFAIGAQGIRITSIKAPGNSGTFSTKSLPAKTTGAWLLAGSGAPPGSSVTAAVKTSGQVTGSFTVVPGSSTSSGTSVTYFDPIVCEVSKAVIPSSKFTVAPRASYDSAVGAWHLGVNISGAGTVSVNELEPTVGTSGSKQQTTKSLVHSRKRTLKSRGTVTMTLQPTASGLVALKTNGSIKVKLVVAFAPTGGKSASKIIRLTLKK
jgi:hypothetical protein